MRKAISMLMVLAFGASLWANQNVQKAKGENQRPLIHSERISNTSRTESYTLQMLDSYGDGWQDSRLKLTVDGQVYFFAIPSPYTSGIEINKTLEAYTGDDNSGYSTVTIPSNATNMKWEWIVGRYPEETSYTISYTKLDGSRGQDSFNEANGPGGEKILSICQ